MTEAEKKEIVALVMSEISGQAVDFDLQTVTPQRTDILPAVRPDGAGGYTGVTLDWGGITDELTTQAKGFRDEALQAKRDTELLKGETNAIKSDVEDIYRQFNEAVDKTIESVRNVYQSDLTAESTARQTADNTLQQNIDSEASTRAEADTALGARIDSETTTRESEVAELERVNAIQKYEIENLKAKAEGQIYREEIVDGEAYTLDVPSSVSPYAEVQKIGGKSVVWNQLIDYSQMVEQTHNGINFRKGTNGYLYANGTSIDSAYTKINSFSVKVGDKFYIKVNQSIISTGFIMQINDGAQQNFFENKPSIYTAINNIFTVYFVVNSNITVDNVSIRPIIINLTQMFGSGNEPTLEKCNKIFSADYYPYDAGTIKSFPVKRVRSLNAEGTEIGSMDVSSVTSDLKSTPLVKDEWINGRKIIRLAECDLGALTWNYGSTNNLWYSNEALPNQMNGTFLFCETVPFEGMNYNGSNLGTNVNGTVNVWVRNGSSTNPPTGKAIYILKTPTRETVPEIDNYINVEGGGTLTFESDDAVQMPVPSTDRFVVDLTSTTEETT